MPLFTGKGDKGMTTLFGGEQVVKNSARIEALGAVDELNAFVGVVKLKGGKTPAIAHNTFFELLDDVQHDLFVIQAELAGASKQMTAERVTKIEEWVRAIETELPPITSFFVSGGTELAALLDIVRTIARRAERRVVAALPDDLEKGTHNELLSYMNRLSSLLYALARLANHRAGVPEERPRY